jgi:probable phosphoglycerate mutase
MRIIFVRHGHPDYKADCLTELGHLQAEAAADRLENEKIAQVFSSSKGRAMQTAEHIANRRQLPVIACDFMREIGWGSLDEEPIYENGHPWFTAKRMVSQGESVVDPQWASKEPFCKNRVTNFEKIVSEGLDEWLAQLGYVREGLYYRVVRSNPDTVVMGGHGGSSCMALAHMFNLPFTFCVTAINPHFTGITVIGFDGKEGDLISPYFELANDARHIAGIDAEKGYGN